MDTNFIISLESIADVNAFANTIAHFKSEIDLSSGRHIAVSYTHLRAHET